MNNMRYIFAFLFSVVILFSQSQLDDVSHLMLQNKFNEAANILESDLMKNENADAYLKLGLCYKNLMINNRALDALEKANELKPEDIDILTNLALLYSTIGFDDKAVSVFEKVVSIDSANIFAKINLSKLYIDAGNWEYAKLIYTNLLKSDSINSFYHRQLGYIFQKENDWATAYEYYKTSLQLNHADLFTISNLSKVYFQKEQPDSAIAILDKGLETFKNNTQLLKLKSDIYFSLKNYSGAVNAIVRLIANGDESAQLYQRLGICYYQIAVDNFIGEAQILKLESAAEALHKSFSIDSTQSITQLYLGLTYKELEKNNEAIAHLQKAYLLIYPTYTPTIFTNLAIVYNRIGNYKNSIKNFKTAREFDKTNPNYLYYLASTYDLFYYDKQVPLLYYEMFVASETNIEPALKNYALNRINELKEVVHFQSGSSKNK